MKKYLKNLNIIERFNSLAENINFKIKNSRIATFRSVIIIYSIIFSIFLFLSIPGLFDFEKRKEEIKKVFQNDFNLHVSINDEIEYRFVPSPHLILKKTKIGFNSNNSSNIGEFDNIKLYISLYQLYKNKNIVVKELLIKKGNFYFKNNSFELFNNHLEKTLIKPIKIVNSNFFYINNKNEVATISPIYNIDYYIDIKSKEKKFKLKGNLFDINYNFSWKKNYNFPSITNSDLAFKNPNLRIKHKKIKDKESYNGNFEFNFLRYNSYLNYNFEENILKFTTQKKDFSELSLDGKVSINPFFFNINTNVKNQNLEFILNEFISKLYDYKDVLHSHFNGNLNINFTDIKNTFTKSGFVNIFFENSKIKINNKFKIKKIGFITFENLNFEEKDEKVYINSSVLIDIENKDEFFRRFSISKGNKIDLKKISLEISKNIDTDEYYLSNIIINNNLNNKNNSSSAIYTNYKFSNIQQLRRIIRNEFSKFN
tara:strand:- start:2760 stop:4211 length:1452 start_codon:yes stop_codon:yes gene_type:complete